MDYKIKLKLTPKQFEVFVADWQCNFSKMTFEEYFENLLKELDDERQRKNN